MKIITTYLIIVLSLFSPIKAQNTFYTFLDGWFGVGVVEIGDSIKTVSNYQEYYNNVAWLKINTVDNDGNLLDVWSTQNDSIDFEDAGGYYSADFTDTNRWFVSNCYNVNSSGFNNYYPRLFRFSDKLDSIDIAFKIPFSIIGIEGKIDVVKYISDSTILLGEYIQTSSQNKALRFICVDNEGNVNWDHIIPSVEWSHNYFYLKITSASDGGYFLSCIEVPVIHNITPETINKYSLLIKTDHNGIEEWRKRIHGQDYTSYGGALMEKDSNSYLITWAERYLIHRPNSLIGPGKGIDSACVWIGEIDLSGNFKWKKNLYNTAVNCDTLTNGNEYLPYNLLHLQDGNYLICVNNQGFNTVYIKVTPNGEVIWNRTIEILEEENPDEFLNPDPFLNIRNTIESADGGFLGIGWYNSPPGDFFSKWKSILCTNKTRQIRLFRTRLSFGRMHRCSGNKL